MRREVSEPGLLAAAVGSVRLLVLPLMMVAACAHPGKDREWSRRELEDRTGLQVQTRESDQAPRAALGDELDAREASELALSSSPAFAADLARLQAAEADVLIARQVENPRLSALAPFGTISASATLLVPLTSLLQRPARTKAAARAQEAAAESLVQTGLDLVRDVRVTHADCLLAQRQQSIQEELAGFATELAALTENRVLAGELAGAQGDAVRADADRAFDAWTATQTQASLCRARLEALVGVAPLPELVEADRRLPTSAPPLGELLGVAKDARPDVRAALLQLEAAGARAGWERWRILSVSAQADLQWTSSSVGARVGGSVELPIFNQNRGGVARAEADIAQAWHRAEGLRQQVVLEIATSRGQFAQAQSSADRFTEKIVPALTRTFEAASLRFSTGDDSYLPVLDALRQLADARLRAAQLEGDVRRAWAELERATGAQLQARGATETPS